MQPYSQYLLAFFLRLTSQLWILKQTEWITKLGILKFVDVSWPCIGSFFLRQTSSLIFEIHILIYIKDIDLLKNGSKTRFAIRSPLWPSNRRTIESQKSVCWKMKTIYSEPKFTPCGRTSNENTIRFFYLEIQIRSLIRQSQEAGI